VNNAGGQFPAPLMAIGKKGFETVLANNLTGGFLMMRELYLQSMQAHGGAIVNMTADMWKGMPGMGHSGAARAGMANLTKTAAVEWAASGVRVNAVAPGWIASSGMDTYQGPVREMIPRLKRHVPLRRLAPNPKSARRSASCSRPARPSSPASRWPSTAARRLTRRCSRLPTTAAPRPSTASIAASRPTC
jgi:NAD(P)-dependent dehydrogenase (short-subunit alcohol dehydrogenase family)